MTDQDSNVLRSSGTYLSAYLERSRIDPDWSNRFGKKIDLSRFQTPTAARVVSIYRLEGVRNAWSTAKAIHHDIEFDLRKLQWRAEMYRARGETLWIEARDALWLKFENANLLIIRIDYGRYLDPVRHEISGIKRGNIIDFLEFLDYMSFEWFAYYELADWRPDLAGTRKREKYRAISSGGNYILRWSHPEPCDRCSEFRLFSNEFVEQCLGSDEVANLYEFARG